MTLQVDQVTIVRGGVPVVRELSLTVERGRTVALLGPSGAGKSSLLHAVAGLVPLASGRVLVADRDVTGLPPEQRDVGLMFQEFALFPHLSVRDNVAYGLRMRGVGRVDRRERAETLLQRVDLAGYGDRDVATLSGGQRQRVALARALATEPSVLLLDEPLGALDRQLREDLLRQLRAVVADDGPAAIAVTHDRDEAFGLGDTVGVLRDGELVALDTPDRLWHAPPSAWVARFLGHDNVLEGVLLAQLGLTDVDAVAVPGRGVTLTDAPGSAADPVGTVVGVGWRDGRRRVRVDVRGTEVVAEVDSAAHGPGDRVTVRVQRSLCIPVAVDA